MFLGSQGLGNEVEMVLEARKDSREERKEQREDREESATEAKSAPSL